jgi:hypothetical protein
MLAGTAIRDSQKQPARDVLANYISLALLTKPFHQKQMGTTEKRFTREPLRKVQAFAVSLVWVAFLYVPFHKQKCAYKH